MAVLSRLKDPFALTPDPAMYVPRADTEAALSELQARVTAGASATTLMGPSGFGKTLLLRLLGERLGSAWRVVYLPYPKLSLDEVWNWLHRDPSAEASEGSARAMATEAVARGGGLLLCIDDAHEMPAGTRQALEKICHEQPGLAVIWAETCAAEDLVAAPDVVTLGTPLTPAECDEYLWGRLDRGLGNAAERAVFRGLDARLLAQQTAGVPAQIHRVAIALLRGEAPRPRARRARQQPARTARTADWTTPQWVPPQWAESLADGPGALDMLEVDPGFEGRLEFELDREDAPSEPPAGLVLDEHVEVAGTLHEPITGFGAFLEVDPFDPVAQPSLELDRLDTAEPPLLECDPLDASPQRAAPAAAVRPAIRPRPRPRARPAIRPPISPARAPGASERGAPRRRRLVGAMGALLVLCLGAGVLLSGVLTPDRGPFFSEQAKEAAAPRVSELAKRSAQRPDVSAGPAVAGASATDAPTDFGTLSIKAPPGTLVLVDGERRGETPLADLRVPYGERRVIVRFAEGRYRGFSVEIGPTPTVLEFAEAGRAVR